MRRLRSDERGVATIEFALLSVLFFVVMSAALDIGIWYQQRLRVEAAVEQGAVLAFASRDNVDQASIRTFVSAAAKLATAPTVTVGCNGGTSNCVNSLRTCACVSGIGALSLWTVAACNAACPDGSLAGYYMTIEAQTTSSTTLVPASLLSSVVQRRRAVVRLQ